MMGGSTLLTIGMVVMMVVMMGGMIGGAVLALGRRVSGRRDGAIEPPAAEQEQAPTAADGGS